MSETTHWTGPASGARTGTMTVEITRDGTHMTGTLHILEPGVGEIHSKFAGQWTTANKLSAETLDYFISHSGGAVTLPRTGNMEGTFDVKRNAIIGQWRTEVDSLGEFRWTPASSPDLRPPGALVAVPTQVARGWERFATSTKMFFGKPRTWDERHKKWLVLALQLAIAGFIGYLVVAFVIDLLVGN